MTAGRVSADRQVCMGSGLCAHVAPAYFNVEEGTVRVQQEQLAAADVDEVAEAVESCPTRALSFTPPDGED